MCQTDSISESRHREAYLKQREKKLNALVIWFATDLVVLGFLGITLAFSLEDRLLPPYLWLFILLGIFVLSTCLWCGLGYSLGESIRVKVKLIKEGAKSDERPPVLFLRPFTDSVLTQAGVQVIPSQHGLGPDGVLGGESFSFHLGFATESIGRLVVIGKEEERFGDSKDVLNHTGMMFNLEHLYIKTQDDKWFEVFRYIANCSKTILLIPETSGGIAQEIQAIIDLELTSKVLVFMPPTPENLVGEGCEDSWQRVQAFWKRKGLFFPDYDQSGMIYQPNADFSIKACKALGNKSEDLYDYSVIRNTILNLLPKDEVNLCPLSEVILYLERNQLSIGSKVL